MTSAYAGHIWVESLARELLWLNQQGLITRLLLDTIPNVETIGLEREPVAGEVPNPISPPLGCGFHPRCPFVNDRCRGERPELLDAAGTLVACHAVEEGRLD